MMRHALQVWRGAAGTGAVQVHFEYRQVAAAAAADIVVVVVLAAC